ncbi:MAG TPA: hypothetical protein VMW29_03050 [Candidatus Bathyarchaeia archaeon]|nr:hypothetical protein [Candidatus Bathyarchaeia archaeon]
MTKKITSFLYYFLIFILLIILTKGKENSLLLLKNKKDNLDASVGSPFESSGSRARYALTEALVEDKTLVLNEKRALFALPDVVSYKNKRFSVFTPGVAFFGLPFYFLGKFFGLSQIFTYFSTALLALINTFLIAKLARKLGAGLYSAILSGFVFLFATNALSYTLTYTQHQATTTLVLLALLNLFGEKTLLKNIWLGALFGIGLLMDLSNAIILSPIVLAAIIKHFHFSKSKQGLKISLKLRVFQLIIGLLPFLGLFGWYNYQLTGSPIEIGQMVGRADYSVLEEAQKLNTQQTKDEKVFKIRLPFVTRKQLNGFYILLLSDERGWLFYSPILIMGFIGLALLYKNKIIKNIILVLFSVCLINILAYSMFGDPWGGWAFGPRYLIPAAAILCIGIGTALTKYRHNLLFNLIFLFLVTYSLAVNVIGAMTTTQVPPKVEAINLATPIPYTYEYNIQLIKEGKISSLVYNLFLSNKITGQQFVTGYFVIVLIVVVFLFFGDHPFFTSAVEIIKNRKLRQSK